MKYSKCSKIWASKAVLACGATCLPHLASAQAPLGIEKAVLAPSVKNERGDQLTARSVSAFLWVRVSVSAAGSFALKKASLSTKSVVAGVTLDAATPRPSPLDSKLSLLLTTGTVRPLFL